jgi:DNA-binding NarL/FixJ family response regulator
MPTVLVIDDDPATADALRRVAPSDWTVATAPDGVAGLDMVRRRAPMPDVVVLDVQMPHDGVLTALQLRRQHPNLPIVPCTAFPEFLGVLADLGCAPPLLKPCAPDVLLAAVAAAAAAGPAPPRPLAVWEYLHARAVDHEEALRRARRTTAALAILASSAMMAAALAQAAQGAGMTTPLCETDAATLALLLRGRVGLAALLADDACADAAMHLAQQHGLAPIIIAVAPHRVVVLAPRLAAAKPPGAALALPFTAPLLHAAVTAVQQGQAFSDPRPDAALKAAGLSATHIAIARATLAGMTSDGIAHELQLLPQSVRVARMRIYERTCGAGGDIAALRDWVDARVRAML